MKFLPSFDLFDTFFNEKGGSRTERLAVDYMKTDITETANEYVLEMELPGYNKSDIHIALVDGYLTVTATKDARDETKDDKGNVIRKERMHGTTSRSFYVADSIKEADIKAKFENGELKIWFPKPEHKDLTHANSIPID